MSSEIHRLFMNIQSSHEVERCPEGEEVEWRKVFMIRAQELRKSWEICIITKSTEAKQLVSIHRIVRLSEIRPWKKHLCRDIFNNAGKGSFGRKYSLDVSITGALFCTIKHYHIHSLTTLFGTTCQHQVGPFSPLEHMSGSESPRVSDFAFLIHI